MLSCILISSLIFSFLMLIGEQFNHFFNLIKPLHTLIETGIATFFGAWAAFVFNRYETKKEISKRENSALIRTQFILNEELKKIIEIKEFYDGDLLKYNDLIAGQKENKNDSLQWVAIYLGIFFLPELNGEVKIDELMFMLNKQGGYPALLGDVLSLITGYHHLLSALDRRNKIQSDIRPIILKIPKESLSLEEIKKAINIDLKLLVSITERITLLHDQLIPTYCNVINLLISYIDNAKEYNDKSLPVYMFERFKKFLPIDHPLLTKVVWKKDS